MQNNTVLKELICMNSGESNIACAENNMWFNEDPKYADFVRELKESIQNNDVRGSILIAADREIIFVPDQHLGSHIAEKLGVTYILWPG